MDVTTAQTDTTQVQIPPAAPAAPVTPPAPATPPAAPATPSPFEHPDVKKKIDELSTQVFNFEKIAKMNPTLQKQLEETKAELDNLKKAQMTEEEKRETERKDAIERARIAEETAKNANLELTKTRLFLESGLDRKFLKFVSGTDEIAIQESLQELKKTVDEQVASAVAAKEAEFKATAPTPSATPSGIVTQPPKPEGTPVTFTKEQIAKMTPQEYKQNRPAILEAQRKGLVK